MELPAPSPAMGGAAVTRVEVVDHIGAAFGAGPQNRTQLVAAAASSGARAEVVSVLGRLPIDRKFTRPHDLWHDLADVPIDG